jgi:hypothetical protein
VDKYVLASGAVLGLIAGAISGIVFYIFMGFVYLFVSPWLSTPGEKGFPPPSLPPLNWAWFQVVLVLLELCFGVLPGLVFSYFHQSADDPVQIRRGFKYGVTHPLPYIFFGVLLARYVDPFYVTVYYIAALTVPVLLFGLLLVWMWNLNWGV